MVLYKYTVKFQKVKTAQALEGVSPYDVRETAPMLCSSFCLPITR